MVLYADCLNCIGLALLNTSFTLCPRMDSSIPALKLLNYGTEEDDNLKKTVQSLLISLG